MLHECSDCATRYAVGLDACPNCGSSERVEVGAAPSVPLRLSTSCHNRVCRFGGVQRWISLRLVTPGVVELPRLMCAGCGGEMPFTWPLEGHMPKITVYGGASSAADQPYVGESEPEPVEFTEATVVIDVGDGGVASSETEVESEAEPGDDPTGYAGMTVIQLREQCKARGLSTSGTKAELIARLENGTGDVQVGAQAASASGEAQL